MTNTPRIAFIGAGSTVFLRNLVGDILQMEAMQRAHLALMDIDEARLDDAHVVTSKLIRQLAPGARVTTHASQRQAIEGADFVIVAFQIGGYRPGTVTDFEIPKAFGLRQTIGDTLGIGGIMRGLRTVPQLWSLCADMLELCPDALMLQYVNPMAINMWAIAEKFPAIKAVGLCHSVQWTIEDLAWDLDLSPEQIRFRSAGINHMAFFLTLEEVCTDGSHEDLYPRLIEGYRAGRIPKPNRHEPNCPNLVRYEVMTRLGYFVTESSEHFAEYVPWFIKEGRADLVEKFAIPLDEYPARCERQIEDWERQSTEIRTADTIPVEPSREYASDIINSVCTGSRSVIYGNVPNHGLISSLPARCAVEVPCLVDCNGIQPVKMGSLPPQLTAIMRTNINVQELTVAALMQENRDHVYHAAMMDPHTAAELDLEQITGMVDQLVDAHGEWLPSWLGGN